MWKKIKDSQYFLLFCQDSGYKIYVTDYISLWNTVYSEKAFLAQIKQSNEGLELENDSEFIEKCIYLLSNTENLKKLSILKDENGISLFITMTISFGFPFFFECKLSKGSDELYFQIITQPLLKVISDLRTSQSELRRLLIKKDNEIEEYKCEGGEIVLRHLKTVAFNDVDHMKVHKAYEENFGSSDIPLSLIEKPIKSPQQKIIKQEPKTSEMSTNTNSLAVKIKTEPVVNIKTEPVVNIKSEPVSGTQTEESSSSVISSVSCQQEVIKQETNTLRTHVPRKRSKFNF